MFTNLKTKKRFCSSMLFAGLLYSVSLSVLSALQGTEHVTAYECTQVALEDIDPALLTKAEKIALLEGSLQESIDSYSTCVSSVQQNLSNGEGAGGNGQEGSKDALNGSNENLPTETVNQGSEGTPSQEKTDAIEKQQSIITPAARQVIAPKDNDKIICKLLFQEIQKVEDPDMLKGLKEQYSNYKCG